MLLIVKIYKYRIINNNINMLYYYLPFNNNSLNESDIFFNDEPTHQVISHTLQEYIVNYKQQIDKVHNEWDNMKRITNPYEFIHTHVPGGASSMATLKPLSRSFYKMVEICNDFNLCNQDSSINTFHLAEGPGGFIEALTHMRTNSNDKFFGMTLLDDNDNTIPGWKKSNTFLSKNSDRVIIENGPSNDGNLFLVENLSYCYSNYFQKMDLITADGGFDFSENFNEQEHQAIKLLFSQVIYALCMQKTQGSFVLKVFDITSKASLDIIYLLSCFYKEIIICKPLTSRIANSEKYIICKNFNPQENYKSILRNLISNYKNIMSINNIHSFLKRDHDLIMVSKLEEINAIFGQQQVENISFTLGLIINRNKYDRIEQMKRNHINKCIDWCKKYNIPCEHTSEPENIFLQKKK